MKPQASNYICIFIHILINLYHKFVSICCFTVRKLNVEILEQMLIMMRPRFQSRRTYIMYSFSSVCIETVHSWTPKKRLWFAGYYCFTLLSASVSWALSPVYQQQCAGCHKYFSWHQTAIYHSSLNTLHSGIEFH